MTASTTARASRRRGFFHGGAAGAGARQRGGEHQPVERGIGDAVGDIGAADREEARPGAGDPVERRAHALGQRLEAAGGDGGEEVALFGKMLVGRVVAHPGAPRHFAQREGPVLRLGDQRQRRLDQRRGEAAMVIRARRGGGARGGFLGVSWGFLGGFFGGFLGHGQHAPRRC